MSETIDPAVIGLNNRPIAEQLLVLAKEQAIELVVTPRQVVNGVVSANR